MHAWYPLHDPSLRGWRAAADAMNSGVDAWTKSRSMSVTMDRIEVEHVFADVRQLRHHSISGTISPFFFFLFFSTELDRASFGPPG